MVHPLRLLWPSLAFLLLPGCGAPAPQTAEVEGTILWKHKPLKNVQVQFLPDVERQTQGPRSTAITDEHGRYTLYMDDDQPGAVVGHHIIVLTESDEDTQRPRKGEDRRTGSRSPSTQQTASHAVLPDQYKRAATTPLKREVQPGSQTIDFDLP
jgi:hypothetical protein